MEPDLVRGYTSIPAGDPAAVTAALAGAFAALEETVPGVETLVWHAQPATVLMFNHAGHLMRAGDDGLTEQVAALRRLAGELTGIDTDCIQQVTRPRPGDVVGRQDRGDPTASRPLVTWKDDPVTGA